MRVIHKYFPALSKEQVRQFGAMDALYREWNDKVNLISRKDIGNLYLHHVLHSLAIARIISFRKGTVVLDMGTGGGFPGLPLAVIFPEASFVLVDSIGKKINAVQHIAAALGLGNVRTVNGRVEDAAVKADFITVRAVAPLDTLLYWTKGKIRPGGSNLLKNGLLCLKGGELHEELKGIRKPCTVYRLADHFEEAFFETKLVVHVEVV